MGVPLERCTLMCSSLLFLALLQQQHVECACRATTHTDLQLRAHALGIPVEVTHNASHPERSGRLRACSCTATARHASALPGSLAKPCIPPAEAAAATAPLHSCSSMPCSLLWFCAFQEPWTSCTPLPLRRAGRRRCLSSSSPKAGDPTASTTRLQPTSGWAYTRCACWTFRSGSLTWLPLPEARRCPPPPPQTILHNMQAAVVATQPDLAAPGLKQEGGRFVTPPLTNGWACTHCTFWQDNSPSPPKFKICTEHNPGMVLAKCARLSSNLPTGVLAT